MLRWLLDNVGNLVLSIMLAVLVWIVAVQEANPDIVEVFGQDIPIDVLNTPAGMILYEESTTTVRITLSAPQSSWDVLTKDRITAAIDLSGHQTGTLELPVQVAVADRFARIIKVEPSVITLKMEQLAEKRVPIEINVVGEPALGYSAAPVTTVPETALVRGPASAVEQVSMARGQLSIQNTRATISDTLSITPRSADRRLASNVTLMPDTALATVRVEQLGGFRDLAVKIDLLGNVAPGYLIGNVTVNPQIATVFGSQATLDALPGFISTEAVTVTDATANIEERVRLSLPSGVSMLGDPFVQISVQVDAIEGSLRLQRPLTTTGLLSDLYTRLSPEAVDVIISGPLPRLDTLRADDVVAVLNLLGLDVGTHQVIPEISVPTGLKVVSVLPATVQVLITTEPLTPALTLTPTITSTVLITSPLPTPVK